MKWRCTVNRNNSILGNLWETVGLNQSHTHAQTKAFLLSLWGSNSAEGIKGCVVYWDCWEQDIWHAHSPFSLLNQQCRTQTLQAWAEVHMQLQHRIHYVSGFFMCSINSRRSPLSLSNTANYKRGKTSTQRSWHTKRHHTLTPLSSMASISDIQAQHGHLNKLKTLTHLKKKDILSLVNSFPCLFSDAPTRTTTLHWQYLYQVNPVEKKEL